MKITALRLRAVSGRLEHAGTFWEDWLVRPFDMYTSQHAAGDEGLIQDGEGRYRLSAIFLELRTDSDLIGLAGPIGQDQAYLIDRQLKQVIIGQDPLATERIWDMLYRAAVHGRKGVVMQAISAIDCALWDLKGKWAGVPVYRLLGGPLRETIPAYASTLGYSVEPDAAARRAQELAAQGYRAMKWFFKYGPAAGSAGMARNLALARAVRAAVGDDVDLMFDAWMSWDVAYATQLGLALAEVRPRWLEEPVPPDRIASVAELRRRLPFPTATGEHEYTRWGAKQLLDAGASDVLQPDIYWAGGISELVKICTLASTYDVQVIPHGHSTHASAHLLYAQPPQLCPFIEYLLKWNEINQHFFRTPLRPVNGVVVPPEAPGMGMELDDEKILQQQELGWD
ncbi:MAG TPA: enolase C-terminal domain-like protein [Chloroflexota bacterium]|nr:enolase C-terminal domain-like protein [Chloroflexota bacterium]